MAGPYHTTRGLKVPIHGGNEITVTYTNDSTVAATVLQKFENVLRKGTDKFMGLDFEYMNMRHKGATPRVAVVQLGVGEEVLVFQWCSSNKNCPALLDFLVSKGITFASVDTYNDKRAMEASFGHGFTIPEAKYVDLQKLFRVDNHEKTGMAKMATAIIDPTFYVNMKDNFDGARHEKWHITPLDQENTNYAAVDAYVSYEVYRRIVLYRQGTRHLQVQQACPCCEARSSGAGKRGRDGGDGSGWNDDGGRQIVGTGGWNHQSAGTGGWNARLQSAGTGGWNAGRQTASSAGRWNDGRRPQTSGWTGWNENKRRTSPPLLGWNDNGGRQTPVSGGWNDNGGRPQTPVSGGWNDGGHQQTGGWNDDGGQIIVPTGWDVVDLPLHSEVWNVEDKGAGTSGQRWGKDVVSGWGN